MSLGGHLVTINDQAEQNWLYTTFGFAESESVDWVERCDDGRDLGVDQRRGRDNTMIGRQVSRTTYDDWWGGEADYGLMQSDGTWDDFRQDLSAYGIG